MNFARRFKHKAIWSYLIAHPAWVKRRSSRLVETEELGSGTRHVKYKTHIFRHEETGEDIETIRQKEKVWVEWDDGSETTEYKRYGYR